MLRHRERLRGGWDARSERLMRVDRMVGSSIRIGRLGCRKLELSEGGRARGGSGLVFLQIRSIEVVLGGRSRSRVFLFVQRIALPTFERRFGRPPYSQILRRGMIVLVDRFFDDPNIIFERTSDDATGTIYRSTLRISGLAAGHCERGLRVGPGAGVNARRVAGEEERVGVRDLEGGSAWEDVSGLRISI